jgi:hypothetical protein
MLRTGYAAESKQNALGLLKKVVGENPASIAVKGASGYLPR